MKEGRIRRWASPFFGLTDEYKIRLHELLFELTHFGNFEYESVYSMPVQFRMFYYKKLINIKEKEQSDLDKSQGKTTATPSKIVKGPQLERR